MVSYLEPVANNFLLLTNILSTVKIDKLLVPEIIANDCIDAVLDCGFSGVADDVTVLWLYNGTQVYEWRQGTAPKVSGVLDGRLDMKYSLTSAGAGSNRPEQTLRIVELSPELSGDYTCVVRSRGQEARETKSMTVFSPERDFELTFSASHNPDVVDFKCIAKRLHPQPDLVIEYNKVPIAQQQQRIWREGPYFDAECVACLLRRELRPNTELACRLQIFQVDYTAITKKYLNFGIQVNSASVFNLTLSIIASVIISSMSKNY